MSKMALRSGRDDSRAKFTLPTACCATISTQAREIAHYFPLEVRVRHYQDFGAKRPASNIGLSDSKKRKKRVWMSEAPLTGGKGKGRERAGVCSNEAQVPPPFTPPRLLCSISLDENMPAHALFVLGFPVLDPLVILRGWFGWCG